MCKVKCKCRAHSGQGTKKEKNSKDENAQKPRNSLYLIKVYAIYNLITVYSQRQVSQRERERELKELIQTTKLNEYSFPIAWENVTCVFLVGDILVEDLLQAKIQLMCSMRRSFYLLTGRNGATYCGIISWLFSPAETIKSHRPNFPGKT